MTDVEVEIEPEEAGIDSVRIQRLGKHLSNYVDAGRLPGVNL